jgi:anti-sigma B factor antagonist
MMEITTTMNDETATVSLRGRFDAHEAANFRSAVSSLIEECGLVRIDLSDIVFIDSTALAELVRLSRTAQARNSDFILCDPSVPVRVILELTGLNLALRIEDRERSPEPS